MARAISILCQKRRGYARIYPYTFRQKQSWCYRVSQRLELRPAPLLANAGSEYLAVTAPAACMRPSQPALCPQKIEPSSVLISPWELFISLKLYSPLRLFNLAPRSRPRPVRSLPDDTGFREHQQGLLRGDTVEKSSGHKRRKIDSCFYQIGNKQLRSRPGPIQILPSAAERAQSGISAPKSGSTRGPLRVDLRH